MTIYPPTGTPNPAVPKPDLKWSYDRLRRAIYPDAFYVDLATDEIVRWYYPTYDQDNSKIVPMEDLQDHGLDHQYGANLGCFCKLLFGIPVHLRVFCVKKNTKWRGQWVIGCGNYNGDKDPGCGLWTPIGNSKYDILDRRFFTIPRKNGRLLPLHYYPRVGSPPNPPPREVFTLDDIDTLLQEFDESQPGGSQRSELSPPPPSQDDIKTKSEVFGGSQRSELSPPPPSQFPMPALDEGSDFFWEAGGDAITSLLAGILGEQVVTPRAKSPVYRTVQSPLKGKTRAGSMPPSPSRLTSLTTGPLTSYNIKTEATRTPMRGKSHTDSGAASGLYPTSPKADFSASIIKTEDIQPQKKRKSRARPLKIIPEAPLPSSPARIDAQPQPIPKATTSTTAPSRFSPYPTKSDVPLSKALQLFAKFQDPARNGISKADMANLQWTCPLCSGIFAAFVQDSHSMHCIEIIDLTVSDVE